MRHPRCRLLAVPLLSAALWLLPHSAARGPLPPGTADLLEAFRLGQNPAVSATGGFCTTREGSNTPDLAYRLNNKTVLSVPSATVFPDGFPYDFSILSVFRTPSSPSRGQQLFTAYSVMAALSSQSRLPAELSSSTREREEPREDSGSNCDSEQTSGTG